MYINDFDELPIDMEKLRKRLRKLSNIVREIAPQDLENLRRLDNEIDGYCRVISDMMGSSNPYWRIHPQYPEIRCSINGEVDISGQKFEIREYGGKKCVCYSNSRRKIPAASLILECFQPCPGNRADYRVGYIDKDVNNLKPSNLYWDRIIVR